MTVLNGLHNVVGLRFDFIDQIAILGVAKVLLFVNTGFFTGQGGDLCGWFGGCEFGALDSFRHVEFKTCVCVEPASGNLLNLITSNYY
jgi:hypothetical protein